MKKTNMVDISDMLTEELLKKIGITCMRQEHKHFGTLYLNPKET